MDLQGAVVVVTGAANGIGRALCQRFALEQPKALILADKDQEAANETAAQVGGQVHICDVADASQVNELVQSTLSHYGGIDLFCANAGIAIAGGIEVDDEDWQRVMDVNFMAHVYAYRAVLPHMLARGSGYVLHTSSAAGLLTEMSSAPYSVSKHAVISLAEWMAIEYGDRGLKVSCLCPQGVSTQMLQKGAGPMADMLWDSAISPSKVAECVVQGLRGEQFLILPHPEVADYFQRKGSDYDRWLRGMMRLRRRLHDQEAT